MDSKINEVDSFGRKKYVKCLACGHISTDIRSTHFKSKCVSGIKSKEEYLQKYPNAETKSESARAKNAITEQSLITKYGETEGLKRWNSYRKKHSDKNKLENFIQKGYTKAEFIEYNKSRAVTLENMKKRHGDILGAKKYTEYCERQAYAGCKLEYFIDLYGVIEGTAAYNRVNSEKAITLENMIRVHGDGEGTKRYEKWLKANRYSSLLAEEFIKLVSDKLPSHFKIHSSIHGGEYCIYDDRPYLFDMVITDPVRKCIEFNGDFWHANPAKYQPDDIINLRGNTKKSAQRIWDEDMTKLDIIKGRGFDVKIVWESDFLKDKEQCVKVIIEWILSSNE